MSCLVLNKMRAEIVCLFCCAGSIDVQGSNSTCGGIFNGFPGFYDPIPYPLFPFGVHTKV